MSNSVTSNSVTPKTLPPVSPEPPPGEVPALNLRVDDAGAFLSADARIWLMEYRDKACTIHRHYDFSFTETPYPTAEDLLYSVCAAESISDEGRSLFAVWITNGVLDLQLRPKTSLQYAFRKYPRWVEKYTHDSSTGSRAVQFQVRREAMVTKGQERKVVEEGCLRFLFAEARENVLSGRYPVTVEDATLLCAYNLQVFYGDLDPAKFVSGFSGHLVMQHLPPALHKSRRQIDWERSVLTEYTKLRGRSKLIAHMLYLQFVRQQQVYGSIFYTSCRNMPPNGYFELRTDNHLIAVNTEGVIIINDDTHQVIFSEPYTRTAWLYDSDTVTFEYGPVSNPQSIRLITPQAHLVDRLAFEAVRRIEKREKAIKQISQKQNASMM